MDATQLRICEHKNEARMMLFFVASDIDKHESLRQGAMAARQKSDKPLSLSKTEIRDLEVDETWLGGARRTPGSYPLKVQEPGGSIAKGGGEARRADTAGELGSPPISIVSATTQKQGKHTICARDSALVRKRNTGMDSRKLFYAHLVEPIQLHHEA